MDLMRHSESSGAVAMVPVPSVTEAPGTRLRRAVEAARESLLELQHEDGHWCAELEGDSILGSEYVLCLHFLGRADEKRVTKAASYVRQRQLAEGGWAIYPGGGADVSASVKAYLVLKLAGDDPEAPHMTRARETILGLGGIDACNSFTRIYLAIFGQYPWSQCPAVPPEIVLLPRWLYFNLYAMSSWSRAIVVPLAMIWAYRPCRELPEHARIPELRVRGGKPAHPAVDGLRGHLWSAFFRLVNVANHVFEALRIRPWRRRALARAEAWILERLEKSDGLGAIFPPIINTLIALRCHGYPLDHPAMRRQLRELEKLEIEDGDTLRVQPCKSPVWDTTLALNALLESGLAADHPAAQRAARWMVAKEVREPGDWKLIDPEAPVGGWYFEYANEFYPDCDDTAEVLKCLEKVPLAHEREEAGRRAALARGQAWLLSMQNGNGGWAAFERDCTRKVLTYIPFADHNAMIDPPTVDITARSIEALHALGMERGEPAIERGIRFLFDEQESDGSWYGRWGCNYLYGTWLALRGLSAAGHDVREPRVRRAAEWIRRHQNADGGWGELPASYEDPRRKGQGPSTAAQTAWALMGLFFSGDHTSPAARRGVDYLLARQRPDGTWHDEYWTGTGFPRVFYLRYHLYALYFPLQALGLYEEYMAATCAPSERETELAPARERAA